MINKQTDKPLDNGYDVVNIFFTEEQSWAHFCQDVTSGLLAKDCFIRRHLDCLLIGCV